MKKIAIILILACSINSSAQKYWDNSRPDHRITVGVRTGLNFSKQYNNEEEGADKDYRIGYMGGLELDINIVRTLSVNMGLIYTQKGYKSEYSDYRGSMTEKNNVSYLNIPVLVSYRVKLSDAAQFQLNVGPYFAFGISGKLNVESNFSGLKNYEIDCFDEYDGLKKSDTGLHIGAGVVYSNVYFGVSYERSLKNVSNATGADFRNGCIGINVGYNINL